MKQVISVKFKNRGKIYYFDPGELAIPTGENIIVETAKGAELAECHAGNHYVPNSAIVPPLRPVLRMATAEDLQKAERARERELEAFEVCQKKILERGLDMKLVEVEAGFDGGKIVFFFTSDGRVDFRELVKDLATIFRARIELRQIGVRDEAKLLGGLGVCGLPFCCSRFLSDFHPVSTKMAKSQSLSLNPTKISGSCGRLMCCLRYEQEAYEDLNRQIPKVGAIVETPAGNGVVVSCNVLRQTIKVRMDGPGEADIKTFAVDETSASGNKLRETDSPPKNKPPAADGSAAGFYSDDESVDDDDEVRSAPAEPLAIPARPSRANDGAKPQYRRKQQNYSGERQRNGASFKQKNSPGGRPAAQSQRQTLQPQKIPDLPKNAPKPKTRKNKRGKHRGGGADGGYNDSNI